MYAQTSGHYVHVHTRSEEYRIRMTLKEFQQLLPDDSRLIVCNRGVLVNLDHVKRIENGELLLSTGTRLPAKRRSLRDVENAYLDHLFGSNSRTRR